MMIVGEDARVECSQLVSDREGQDPDAWLDYIGLVGYKLHL